MDKAKKIKLIDKLREIFIIVNKLSISSGELISNDDLKEIVSKKDFNDLTKMLKTLDKYCVMVDDLVFQLEMDLTGAKVIDKTN